MHRALAAAALTSVVLTSATLLVDHGRWDVAVGSPELSAAAPTSPAPEPAGALAPPVPVEPDVPTPPTASTTPPVPTVEVGRNVVFVADYETGDFSQWGTCQSALLNSSCTTLPQGGDRAMKVVEAAAPDGGRFAARFAVRDGDVPEFGGGERAEVSENEAGAQTREGDERWYEWSMRLPDEFTAPTGDWFIVMQWHSGDGSPPLAIDLSRGTVDIDGDGSGAPRQTIGPVRPGEWVNYVLHVRFSSDRDAGFVQAWENGELRVPKTRRATMSSDENYLKQGIYRDQEAGDGPTEVQFAGLRVTAP